MQSLNSILSNGRAPYFYHYKYTETLIAWTMAYSFATPDSIAKKITPLIERTNPPLRLPVSVRRLDLT